MPTPAQEALLAALQKDDAPAVRDAIERFPELKDTIDEPLPGLSFDFTPLLAAIGRGNREAIDVILRAGADIDVKSGWWAGGFGALDTAAPALVPFLLERGA